MTVLPIDWRTVQDAIHAWLSESTGLEAVWRDQAAPQPEYPFASISIISGPTKVAGQDELRTSTDLAEVGEEVLLETVGIRQFTVSCQVYHDAKAARDPNCHPVHWLSIAQGNLNQVSRLAALRAAGIAVVNEGSVTNIDEVINDGFVARANMDVIFYTASNMEERVGYFDQTEISSDIEGAPTSINLNEEIFP